MKTKFIEIRDNATCIPALAIKMLAAGEVEYRFLGRCGFPIENCAIVVMKLNDQAAHSDPYDWGDRTMGAAHLFIEEHFDDLIEGQVVDVRVGLGETTQPAAAEICP